MRSHVCGTLTPIEKDCADNSIVIPFKTPLPVM